MCIIVCTVPKKRKERTCCSKAQCTSTAQTAESAGSSAGGKNALPFKLTEPLVHGWKEGCKYFFPSSASEVERNDLLAEAAVGFRR